MSDEHRRREAGAPEGKTMVGAYVDKTELYMIQELLLRLTRERGVRVTMQDFIVGVLRAELVKARRSRLEHVNNSTYTL